MKWSSTDDEWIEKKSIARSRASKDARDRPGPSSRHVSRFEFETEDLVEWEGRMRRTRTRRRVSKAIIGWLAPASRWVQTNEYKIRVRRLYYGLWAPKGVRVVESKSGSGGGSGDDDDSA